MMNKIISLESISFVRPIESHNNAEVNARLLYRAAGSVFELPDYDQVICYLHGGNLPELPYQNGPFDGPTIGRMTNVNEHYVLIITNTSKRSIEVRKNSIKIYFGKGSKVAAGLILKKLADISFHDVCTISFIDGSRLTDGNMDAEEFLKEE